MMRDGVILNDHLVSQRSDAVSQLRQEHASALQPTK